MLSCTKCNNTPNDTTENLGDSFKGKIITDFMFSSSPPHSKYVNYYSHCPALRQIACRNARKF